MRVLSHDDIRQNMAVIAKSFDDSEPSKAAKAAIAELLAQALCDLRTLAVAAARASVSFGDQDEPISGQMQE